MGQKVKHKSMRRHVRTWATENERRLSNGEPALSTIELRDYPATKIAKIILAGEWELTKGYFTQHG